MALPSRIEQGLPPPTLRAHDAVYRKTNGWIGHRLPGVPGLLLHTVGAKTGQPRTTSLGPVLPGDADYSRLWQIVNKNNGNRYTGCQEKTSRPIPVVALTPH